MPDPALIIPGWIGCTANELGAALALRKDGNEILFAPKNGRPLRWIQTTEFVVDPGIIPSAKQIRGAHGMEDWQDEG